jgi:hypothetical protein
MPLLDEVASSLLVFYDISNATNLPMTSLEVIVLMSSMLRRMVMILAYCYVIT